MSAEAPDPVILEYIRANRGSFSRDEIVRELRLAGHEEAAIDAAWAAIAAAEPTTPMALEFSEPQAPATEQLAAVEPEPFVEPGPVAEPGPFVARDPAIAQYIRANYGVYTRPAVTTSLIEAGHSREDIEAAWAEIAAAEAPRPLPPGEPPRRRAFLSAWEFWVMAVVTFGGLLVLPYPLAFAFADQGVGSLAGCLLFIVAVAGGLIMLAFEKTRNAGYGCLAGVGALFALGIVLTVIGLVLVLVVFGICIAIISQGNTP
jgi:hypothetical protein